MICCNNKWASKISAYEKVLIHAMPNEGKGKCGPELTTIVVRREREDTQALNCLSPEVTRSSGPLARTMVPT